MIFYSNFQCVKDTKIKIKNTKLQKLTPNANVQKGTQTYKTELPKSLQMNPQCTKDDLAREKFNKEGIFGVI